MHRSRLLLVATLLASFTFTGCMTHTYRTGLRPAQAEADYDSWHHHILWGLVTLSDEIDLREICPDGAAVMHNKQTFLNGFVGYLTIGIYSPSTVKVWCAAPTGGSAEIEVEITEEMIEQARLLYPDFDAQMLALHASLSGGQLAEAPSSTATF
jgi:hypothetical protein